MSASLILGGAGAVVGGIFGGAAGASLGWSIGALVGNLIDPPKTQGPRIGDTRLQRSTYGAPIPYCWGWGRLGGIVIDQTDLIEHANKQGGKGGPEHTTYTYSASWISALCHKLPNQDAAIEGITHLFMDARLIWSQDSAEECPCTIYYGTEDQLPDPTFEAIHAAESSPPGGQPAYRGIAYLVFTDHDLSDYGNRIPNVEAVVYTKGGAIPWRVAEFDPWGDPLHDNYFLAGATIENGEITTIESDNVVGSVIFRIRKWNMQGEQIGETIEKSYSGTNTAAPVLNANLFVRSYNTGSGTNYSWLRWAPESEQMVEVHLDIDSSGPSEIPMLYKDGFIFGQLGDSLVKYSTLNGIPTGVLIDSIFIDAGAELTLGDSNEDSVMYVLYGNYPNATLIKFDTAELTVLESWGPAETSATGFMESAGRIFGVYNNIVVGSYQDPEVLDGYRIRLVKIEGATLVEYGGEIPTEFDAPFQSLYLGGGMFLDAEGIYSLNAPALGVSLEEVVTDITTLTPATDYDFAEFANDFVAWYPIGQQTTARNAVEVLRPLYPFDIVEEDYAIWGRRRGEREIVVIPDSDLSARPWGEESPDPLRTIRKREQELPRLVSLKYIDMAADWNTNVASSPRLVTQSEYDVSIEAPVGFEPEAAAQICETIQSAEWVEREGFQWSMRMKWDKVTPASLVNVRGRIIRVQKVLQTTIGVLNCEGVLAAPSLYTQTAPGASSGGVVTQTPRGRPVPTESVLMDIPVITLSDAPYGFYWAAGPEYPGQWAGATLYKSLDGGFNYIVVASITQPSTIGHTRDYEDSPVTSGVLAPYALGDVVDESTLCVMLTNPDLSLESTNADGLDAGANLVAISRGTSASPASPEAGTWELAQYRDADLLATTDDGKKIYALTGWLRGRKGTSTDEHDVGDTFVLMSTAVNVDAPQIELNRELLYKAVTVRRLLSETPYVPFTNTGAGSDEWHDEVGGSLPQTQAPYVLASEASQLLPNSRVLTAGTGVTIDDNGPGDTIVINSSAGSSITAKDEGSTLTTTATSFDFTGAGVSASAIGNAVTVNVAGASSATSWVHTFGDGADGAAVFDGVNAVTGASRSGSVYTLTRSVAYTNCQIDSGVTVKFANQGGIWVNGTLTLNGTISTSGNAASGITAGAAVGAAAFWGTQAAGGGAGGGSGGGPTQSLGGDGGAGGASTGGTGGLPAGGGTPGGASSDPSTADGGLAFASMLQAALSGRSAAAVRYTGGGGGSGGAISTGGAGGGAAGNGLVVARLITGTGNFDGIGGNGSNAASGNAGGGGGGGGGALWLVTSETGWASHVTMSVAGGIAGTGIGTGRNGVDGSAGRSYVIVLA